MLLTLNISFLTLLCLFAVVFFIAVVLHELKGTMEIDFILFALFVSLCVISPAASLIYILLRI